MVVAAALVLVNNEASRLLEYSSYESDRQTFYNRKLKPLLIEVVDLTSHTSRRVRVAAARVAASFPSDFRGTVCTPDQRRAFEMAIHEFKESLMIVNERGSSHMLLGSLFEMLGSREMAIESYRTAIRVDPELSGPRTNLASLLGSMASQLLQQLQTAGNSATVKDMQKVVERSRELQLETAELRKRENELLKTDLYRSRDLQNTHALHYRYALSCYLHGDFELTEKHMLLANQQEPDSPVYILVLSTFYRERGELPKAVKFVNQLIKTEPEHPGYRNLATEIAKEVEAYNKTKNPKE